MKFLFSATAFVLSSLAITAQAESCSYTTSSGTKYSGTCMTPSACANANRWWVADQCSGGKQTLINGGKMSY